MADKLGLKLRDIITGFEGVATGYVQYLSGCNQYLLAARAINGEFKDSVWLDEQRLSVVEDVDRISLATSNAGFDRPAPVR